jgi:hypothetical protein
MTERACFSKVSPFLSPPAFLLLFSLGLLFNGRPLMLRKSTGQPIKSSYLLPFYGNKTLIFSAELKNHSPSIIV